MIKVNPRTYTVSWWSVGMVFAALTLHSCRATKSIASPAITKKHTAPADIKVYLSNFRGRTSKSAQQIIREAEKFLGTPYKFGGTTTAGFDCSGLMCTAFNGQGIPLPRRSADQGLQGKEVDVRDIAPGDLLFFATGKSASNVTHVGLVTEVMNDGDIIFIHSSTSKGVIKSSLNEKYWVNSFLFARRIIS